MVYVIQRTDGKYVAPPGREHSYTSKLQHARKFASREAAERDLCIENERVVSLEDAVLP